MRTPWLLYVPFFCPANDYADRFDFVTSVPGQFAFAEPDPDAPAGRDARAFYDMLFDYGQAQGMASFENDFLNYNFLGVPRFRKKYGASARWLGALDAAAHARGIGVQACMALPSDLMESVKFTSITNYRASGDYAGGGNFNIGGSALLAFALGLRPSKDNFWTHRPESSVVTGKPWGPHSNPGSNCELNAIIATLSRGPFGIADKAGDTNKTLVTRSVRRDGLIIQPSKPVTAIDMTWAQPSLGNPRPPLPAHAHVWATSATVGSHTWHAVLSIDVKTAWQLQASDFYPAVDAAAGWVARRWFDGHAPRACADGAGAVASGCVLSGAIASDAAFPTLLNDRPIMVANDTHVFDLHLLAPVFANGWALLGDPARYVSVSARRFARVEPSATGLAVDVAGVADERVAVVALRPAEKDWTVVVQHAVFDRAGTQTLSFE